MSTRSSARMIRRRKSEYTTIGEYKEIPSSGTPIPPKLDELATGTIACSVVCQRKWGAYISTSEQREKQEQPTFLAGYGKISELEKDIKQLYPGFSGEFVDYGTFWSRLQAAGIEKPAPEKMPHREDR